jgi:hypothetical protein
MTTNLRQLNKVNYETKSEVIPLGRVARHLNGFDAGVPRPCGFCKGGDFRTLHLHIPDRGGN